MSEIDIFISSTGVITLDHMRKLNDNYARWNTLTTRSTWSAQRVFDGVKSSTRRLGAQLYFSRERAVQVNVSPFFLGVHGLSTQQFVVPGFPGMSRLIGSWRPWAYSAWTIRAYGRITVCIVRYSPPLAVMSPRGSSVSKRRHCTFLPHFPEVDRVPGACCMCHTNSTIFMAFLACARVCSPEEYALADFSGR